MDTEKGAFHIRFFVQNRRTGDKMDIVNVYGAPHNNQKEPFLVQLVHIFVLIIFLLSLVGILISLERGVNQIGIKPLNKWSHLFNAIIEHWELRD